VGALNGETGWEAPLLGTLKFMSKKLWRRTSLSLHRVTAGEPGSSFSRDFERRMMGALGVESLSLGSSVRGTWRGEPLIVVPKNMISEALEMGVCFHRGPAYGEHGGTLLS
jgi:hypothetical protein